MIIGEQVLEELGSGPAHMARAWLPSGGRLLEIGCSSGYLTHHFLGRVRSMVGLDINPAALASARGRHPHLRAVCSDVERLPFADGSFDAVVMLEQFRIGIAVCALISSLVLNGLTASWLLRLAGRRQIAIYVRHQEWAGVIATTVVVATSIGAAIFTYIGMGNPSHLPDILSVLTALAALLVPIGITYFSRIFANSR